MRLALFSDVHGNFAALRAVLDAIDQHCPDAIYALGDLVGRGPEPEATVRLVRRRRIKTLRGNWDAWVGGAEGWDQRPKRRAHVEAARALMKRRSVERLLDAPEQRRLILEGMTVLLVHGSPRNPVELLTPELPDAVIADAIRDARADVVAVGHSHRAFVRSIDGVLVVNAGTVGYPFGGDPRATFALIDLAPSAAPAAEIVRVPYPLERNLRAIRSAAKKGIVSAEAELRYRRALLGEGPEPLDPLRPTDAGAEALVKILSRPIRDVYQAAASDKLASENEQVRRRRAAVRRLKEAFALARPMLPPRALETPLAKLAELSEALGQRRAPDALSAEIDRVAKEHPAIAEKLRAALQIRRTRTSRRVACLYTRARLVDDGLAALALVMHPKEDGGSVVEAAAALLALRTRAVEGALPGLERSDEPEAAHRLRIALRRLRYAAILLAAPFPDLGLDRIARTASAIDDALGRLNDVTLLLELVHGRRGRRIIRPDDPAPLAALLVRDRNQRLALGRGQAREHGPVLLRELCLIERYFLATPCVSTSFAASAAPVS